MHDGFTIQHLTRQQLDICLWDDCIRKAGNGLIYAYSFYLDNMADNWDALVLSNYEAVMPLPWRKKWSFFYLYQPFLTAQGGVFGDELTTSIVQAFLSAVPKKFRLWDITLNYKNVLPVKNFSLAERSNYVLSLNQPYEDLYKAYRDNIKRNCKKAYGLGCTVSTDISVEAIIELTKLQATEQPQKDFENFIRLYHLLAQKGAAKTYGIISKTGALLASSVFIFSHNRAYYILVGNHPNGRTIGASHALIDAFIKDHAGQNLLLDFEGSDLRNLAFFYSSFGAVEEKYAAIHVNRLPGWARWLKR